MTSVSDHRNRTADHILGEMLYYDSAGHLFRAVSWLDHCQRAPRHTTLLYACIEGRMGIEYLLFEEMVISTGANLSRANYERFLKNRTSFSKMIHSLSPDHEKIQEFTRIVMEMETGIPHLVYWRPKDLEKAWGDLSRYLHWSGARTETTENPKWLPKALTDVTATLEPIWQKITSGQSGLLHPTQMKPAVRSVWNDFKSGSIDSESVKRRLAIIRPIYT